MANFCQVFENEPICKYAESYCEYDGDVEVVCGKCTHGKLFCSKCSEYEPKEETSSSDKRLIDANSLIEDLELLAKHEESFRQSVILGVVHTVKAQSTIDAVEVVRCKDCKHHYWEQEPCHGKSVHYSELPHMRGVEVFKEFFCYYGERKDGDGNG